MWLPGRQWSALRFHSQYCIVIIVSYCYAMLWWDPPHSGDLGRCLLVFVALLEISCFICQLLFVPAHLGYRWLIEAAISWCHCCLRVCTKILWPHPNADIEVVCQKKSDWRFYENVEASFSKLWCLQINKWNSYIMLTLHMTRFTKKKMRFKNKFGTLNHAFGEKYHFKYI